MAHHLPSHVSFGFLGEQAVALDLSVDRYFLLDAAQAEVLRGICTASEIVDDAALNGLMRRRLLATDAGVPVAPVAATPLRSSALEMAGIGANLPLIEVAAFRASASLHLRVIGLKATLGRWRELRRRYAAQSPQDEANRDAIWIAQGFSHTRVLIPAKQLCVPDSLTLARALWHRGIGADVYFGVRLAPFMAHAWVQRGDMLLSDTLNTVGEYTPVFRL